MLLPTKQLISKIETLSKDLSPAQLENFLDIIDAMTALVEEAKIQAEPQETAKQEAIPISALH